MVLYVCVFTNVGKRVAEIVSASDKIKRLYPGAVELCFMVMMPRTAVQAIMQATLEKF